MLVVVPTDNGSNLPGPIFRTFGAVCSKAAPCQSTGGGTPLSKIRIRLASRTPKITPSRSTESPTRSWRIFSSVSGVVKEYSGIFDLLKPKFHFAVWRDFRPPPLRSPALHVHRYRIAGDMRPRRFNVHCQRRGVATEALRADASLVDRIEKF